MSKFSHTQGPSIDQREFTSRAILAMLSGVTIAVVGCGGSKSPTALGSASGDRTGVVTTNHDHVAILPRAQINAGNTVTLDIRGNADHPHTVVATMAEISRIAAGQRVSKVPATTVSATFGTYNHTVIFN